MCKNQNECSLKCLRHGTEYSEVYSNHKSVKIPFVIYADTESLPAKIQVCDNESTKWFKAKINKHTVWLLIIHTFSFDNNKDKYDFYRGGDSRKKFFVNLKEHATEIINCEIKAKKKEEKSYKKWKILSHMQRRIQWR